MHIIQEKLLELSKTHNLTMLSLRDMGKEVGLSKESPQKIKHHLLQLQKKGFLILNKNKGVMKRVSDSLGYSKGFLKNTIKLYSIPIVGTANCGPANIFAEQNFEGFLKISSKLIHKANPDGLYAIKADGSSMNRAVIGSKTLEDGDYAIIDSNEKTANSNDVVLAIVDNKATIKRYINDTKNKQVVLKADSSFDYEPIYLHPDDEFFINGKVIGVIKNN